VIVAAFGRNWWGHGAPEWMLQPAYNILFFFAELRIFFLGVPPKKLLNYYSLTSRMEVRE